LQKRRLPAPAASWKTQHERRVIGLLSEREAIMNEIGLRARIAALPPMLAKARTLLTRFWAKANWQGRAEILSVARMLLVLGAAQAGLATPGRAAMPKRRAAKRTAKAGASRRARKAELSSRAPHKAAEAS
jgi:hypothetical protein